MAMTISKVSVVFQSSTSVRTNVQRSATPSLGCLVVAEPPTLQVNQLRHQGLIVGLGGRPHQLIGQQLDREVIQAGSLRRTHLLQDRTSRANLRKKWN